jgi:hypothetical protein
VVLQENPKIKIYKIIQLLKKINVIILRERERERE